MHNKHVIECFRVMRHIQPMQKERGAFFLIHFMKTMQLQFFALQ